MTHSPLLHGRRAGVTSPASGQRCRRRWRPTPASCCPRRARPTGWSRRASGTARGWPRPPRSWPSCCSRPGTTPRRCGRRSAASRSTSTGTTRGARSSQRCRPPGSRRLPPGPPAPTPGSWTSWVWARTSRAAPEVDLGQGDRSLRPTFVHIDDREPDLRDVARPDGYPLRVTGVDEVDDLGGGVAVGGGVGQADLLGPGLQAPLLLGEAVAPADDDGDEPERVVEEELDVLTLAAALRRPGPVGHAVEGQLVGPVLPRAGRTAGVGYHRVVARHAVHDGVVGAGERVAEVVRPAGQQSQDHQRDDEPGGEPATAAVAGPGPGGRSRPGVGAQDPAPPRPLRLHGSVGEARPAAPAEVAVRRVAHPAGPADEVAGAGRRLVRGVLRHGTARYRRSRL